MKLKLLIYGAVTNPKIQDGDVSTDKLADISKPATNIIHGTDYRGGRSQSILSVKIKSFSYLLPYFYAILLF